MGEANGTVPVLIVTGPVGVGKTTTAMAVSDELERSGVAHAWVDIDQLAQCFPRPADDRFHSRLARRNLTAVCANFLDAGAGRLVFPLVIEDQAGQDTLAACIPGADLTVVRLTVRPETNVARLRGRESAESLAWHLARAPELEGIMTANGIGDHVVATDERTPAEVAGEVLRVIGW